jgi:hypothetical protein
MLHDEGWRSQDIQVDSQIDCRVGERERYEVGPAKPPPPFWEKDMANFVTIENSQKLK